MYILIDGISPYSKGVTLRVVNSSENLWCFKLEFFAKNFVKKDMLICGISPYSKVVALIVVNSSKNLQCFKLEFSSNFFVR